MRWPGHSYSGANSEKNNIDMNAIDTRMLDETLIPATPIVERTIEFARTALLSTRRPLSPFTRNPKWRCVPPVFSRLGMKTRMTQCFCHIAKVKRGTTYDNFVRHFGERFVAGYRAPSVVDLVINTPFKE
jgi:hypothetical protein